MDAGRKYADEVLDKVSKWVIDILDETNKTATNKLKVYLRTFQPFIDKLESLYNAGEITEEEYQQELINKITTGKKWTKIRDEIAKDMSNGQEIAIEATAGALAGIYLYTRNYNNYAIENTLRIKARKKIKMPRHKTHEPISPVKLNRRKNYRWHKLKVESVVRYGMKKGYSVDRMAKVLNRITTMDRHSCIRAVRTSVTNVESMAKLDSFYDAENLGIKSEKQWDAVKDDRTRTSHRIVDGERVPLNEYFSNGLFRPGDPYAEPEEIYNCRCGLKGAVEGYEILDEPKAPPGIGKLEWIGEKPIPKHYDESKKDYMARIEKIKNDKRHKS